MIKVEICAFTNGEPTVIRRGLVSEENFAKFKLVKSEDGIVRITDALMDNAIPEFVEAIEFVGSSHS